jgi:hypothetical protein
MLEQVTKDPADDNEQQRAARNIILDAATVATWSVIVDNMLRQIPMIDQVARPLIQN